MPAPRICLLGVGLYTRADASRLVKMRSEEHTSELQSQSNLVCRLLLEKKKINNQLNHPQPRLEPRKCIKFGLQPSLKFSCFYLSLYSLLHDDRLPVLLSVRFHTTTVAT